MIYVGSQLKWLILEERQTTDFNAFPLGLIFSARFHERTVRRTLCCLAIICGIKQLDQEDFIWRHIVEEIPAEKH